MIEVAKSNRHRIKRLGTSNPSENKRDNLIFFLYLANDVLTKAYTVVPLFLANCKLVTPVPLSSKFNLSQAPQLVINLTIVLGGARRGQLTSLCLSVSQAY